MSIYTEKVLRGELPTDADWNEHLMEAHRNSPSQTPRTFAAHRTQEGLNSYEILARSVAHLKSIDAVIVDLACGDGYLLHSLLPVLGGRAHVVGIDMSEDELAVARKEFKSSQVVFHQTKACSLPLAAASADAVLCHMALMLMRPVEPVVAEISRVLKPGGIFSAILSHNTDNQTTLSEIVNLAFQFLDAFNPKIREAKMGDSRVRSIEGLQELFRPELGFASALEIVDFELQVSLTPEGLWDFMRDMYFISPLPLDVRAKLKSALVSFARKKQNSGGHIDFGYGMRQLTVKKLPLK